MNVLKSIWAVVAGIITIVVLSVLTDYVLETIGVFPPASNQGLFVSWMLIVALIYRTIYAVVGGYVTVWLAPSNPMRHVYILAAIGTVMGTLGAIAGWNLSHHWYPILLVIFSLPAVLWGGKLKARNQTIDLVQ